MDKLNLKVKLREVEVKARAVRRVGLIPAVIYGKGTKNIPVAIDALDFKKIYRIAGHTGLVQLKINDEKSKNVLIHVVDSHALNGKPIHVDFYAVSMKEKIATMVPLNFIGEAPAVLINDGSLIKQKDEVEVEALPAELPQRIDVDLSKLIDFESVIHVSDLLVPEGVKVLTDSEEPIAMVEPPRSDQELEDLETSVEEVVTEAAKEAGETKEETKEAPKENL